MGRQRRRMVGRGRYPKPRKEGPPPRNLPDAFSMFLAETPLRPSDRLNCGQESAREAIASKRNGLETGRGGRPRSLALSWRTVQRVIPAQIPILRPASSTEVLAKARESAALPNDDAGRRQRLWIESTRSTVCEGHFVRECATRGTRNTPGALASWARSKLR